MDVFGTQTFDDVPLTPTLPTEDGDVFPPNYFVFSYTVVIVIINIAGNGAIIAVFATAPKFCNQTGTVLTMVTTILKHSLVPK